MYEVNVSSLDVHFGHPPRRQTIDDNITRRIDCSGGIPLVRAAAVALLLHNRLDLAQPVYIPVLSKAVQIYNYGGLYVPIRALVEYRI